MALRYPVFVAMALLMLVFRQNSFAQKPSFFPFPDSYLGTTAQPYRLSQAGGFNTALASQGDLDNDGLIETLLFDRENKHATILTRQLSGTWVWRPELEMIMPTADDWMALRDYNHDGYPDVFAGRQDFVQLYKNVPLPNGLSQFIKMTDALISTSLSGGPLELTVARTDVPSVVDVDGDGDLDVVCYTYAGSTAELHVNQSIETTGDLEDIHFIKQPCWGKFSDSPTQCSTFALGLSCRIGDEEPRDTNRAQAPNHIGSTLSTFDYDGDGDQDVLVGNISCRNLNLLINGGSMQLATITQVQTNFPDGTRQASFNLFPVGMEVDLDGDALKDLLVSTNQPGNDFSNPVDFSRMGWAYKRNPAGAASQYTYLSNQFWQQDMADFGAHSAPAICDVNLDGVPDLIVGQSDRIDGGGLFGGMTLWTGQPHSGSPIPDFVLADTAFLDVRQRSNEPIIPLSADWNSDGQPDFGYLQTQTNGQAVFTWFEGQAQVGPNGFRFDFTAGHTGLGGIPFTFGDAPSFVDYDADGDPDLVLGREDGNLELYQNNSGIYQLISDQWLGLPPSFTRLSCRPCVADFDGNGQLDVFTTDQRNRPRLYRDVVFSAGFYVRPDSILGKSDLSGDYKPLAPGRWAFPLAMKLDSDNLPDLIVGTGGGGIQLLRNTAAEALSTKPRQTQRLATLSPNPSSTLNVRVEKASHIAVSNTLGQRVAAFGLAPSDAAPRLGQLPKGLYLVTVRSGDEAQSLKWVKE